MNIIIAIYISYTYHILYIAIHNIHNIHISPVIFLFSMHVDALQTPRYIR